MAGVFSNIKKLLTYKEQKNPEGGFELLEEPNEKTAQEVQSNQDTAASQSTDEIVASELIANIEIIKQRFQIPKNQDIIIREFKIGRKVNACIVYVDGMVDRNILSLSIIPQLMSKEVFNGIYEDSLVDNIIDSILAVNNVSKENKFNDITLKILNGYIALFTDGYNQCILTDVRQYEKRNVEQPVVEKVVRGSQEGFTENIRTNITLIRRIIKNKNLVTEMIQLGNTNNLNCAIIYLEGKANTKLVDEVRKRIKKIDAEFMAGNGIIEQFIEDNSFMLLPQVLSTERPDRTASFIAEGHVAIIGDGEPFAIVVPITLYYLLHTAEDSVIRWPFSIFFRSIRVFGFFLSTMLSGMYCAIILFHPEAIPAELLVSIATAKENVPFPTIIEILILEVSFELIREGGIRVPTVVGQTLGIVGALILGQAAVAAGLVSPLLVIVISITAIGSFTIPNQSLSIALRISRFFFILAGAFLGIYGIATIFFIFAAVTCHMKSFGVPFLSPVAPKTKNEHDLIIKYPVWAKKEHVDWLNVKQKK